MSRRQMRNSALVADLFSETMARLSKPEDADDTRPYSVHPARACNDTGVSQPYMQRVESGNGTGVHCSRVPLSDSPSNQNQLLGKGRAPPENAVPEGLPETASRADKHTHSNAPLHDNYVVDTLQKCNERAQERMCPLCNESIPMDFLMEHMGMCPASVLSCEFCGDGVPRVSYATHMATCRRNVRQCYVCRRSVQAASLAAHLEVCANERELHMFHGTSAAAARSIVKNGFQQSPSGLLGRGVYLTRDIRKAKRYGDVVIECVVHAGRVAVIDRASKSLQKIWSINGFHSAWIPPDSGVGPTQEEEHCVYDARRVVPVGIVPDASSK